MKKLFVFFAFCASLMLVSCTWSDKRTPGLGAPYCFVCKGKGYIEKTEFFLFTSYEDCHCKQGVKGLMMGPNINFKGRHGDATPPSASSDGYIYQGSSVKVNGYHYKLYKKNGHKYVYDISDGWCRID